MTQPPGFYLFMPPKTSYAYVARIYRRAFFTAVKFYSITGQAISVKGAAAAEPMRMVPIPYWIAEKYGEFVRLVPE